MKNLLLLLALSFCFQITFGQIKFPKGFEEGEMDDCDDYIDFYQNYPFDGSSLVPPTLPVRSIGEWEELEAIVVSWNNVSWFYPQTLAEIIRYAQDESKVIVVCSNATIAANQIEGYGVDLSSNVEFLEAPFNSVWHRDYGGNACYLNEVDSLVYVDWTYNRCHRPQDNVVPHVIADYLDIPFYTNTSEEYGLVNTGGNFMSDGLGTGFSSKLVIQENLPGNSFGIGPNDEDEIDAIMNQFIGIDRYIKMETLPYDGINHIDMHMKLLDEETIMVGEFPQGVSDGPQIEANIQYVLDNYKSSFGTDYKIVRIPQPPCANGLYPPSCSSGAEYRTYTNALFVNKTILVPIYDTPMDDEALDIWEQAMPGYNIVGIDCQAIINAGGAIHCITKEVGAKDPLWIVHQQVDSTCSGETTLIEASIKHRDGISNAELFYTTDLNAGYESVAMTDDGNDQWSASIPEQEDGTTLYYYVNAEATSGKTISRPITAPEGYWETTVYDCLVINTESVQNTTTAHMDQVYPNPANAITAIPVNASEPLEGIITLKDVLGRTLQVIHQGPIPAGTSNYFIHANHYEPGTYFIQFTTEQGAQTQTLVIK